MASTLIHRRVQQARDGKLPQAICRSRSGWVVIGDVQFLRGYCLLLPDPVVPDLNALRGEARSVFMDELVKLGDAILETTGAKRINYEILGNLEPALHAHVFPRYTTEVAELATKPVWFYDWQNAPKFELERDGDLMKAIGQKFSELAGL
jgi:diadenosine tetraphosphate (Ap4A) HIT family hydrolase